MLNVTNVKTLNVALQRMDESEFDCTGNFIINSNANALVNVGIDYDEQCYDVTIIDLVDDTIITYSYESFEVLEQMFIKKYNLN